VAEPAGIFLAALSYAKTTYDSLKEQKSFMKKLYENVTIMDSGAGEAQQPPFVENGQGDVLIAWEETDGTYDHGSSIRDKYEIVNPSVSILAQPSVAIDG
jgi:sulfate transport system substrate-binding protein